MELHQKGVSKSSLACACEEPQLQSGWRETSLVCVCNSSAVLPDRIEKGIFSSIQKGLITSWCTLYYRGWEVNKRKAAGWVNETLWESQNEQANHVLVRCWCSASQRHFFHKRAVGNTSNFLFQQCLCFQLRVLMNQCGGDWRSDVWIPLIVGPSYTSFEGVRPPSHSCVLFFNLTMPDTIQVSRWPLIFLSFFNIFWFFSVGVLTRYSHILLTIPLLC